MMIRISDYADGKEVRVKLRPQFVVALCRLCGELGRDGDPTAVAVEIIEVGIIERFERVYGQRIGDWLALNEPDRPGQPAGRKGAAA